MKLADINPHIRYCYEIFYKQSQGTVFVKDCRLMCPLSGTGILEIGNNTYKLKEGTIFYCNSGSTYSLTSDEGFKLICINFDLDRKAAHITQPFSPIKINSSGKKETVNQCYVENSSFLNSYILLNNASGFTNSILSLAEEFKHPKNFYLEKASSLLKCILIDMHRLDTVTPANAMVNTIILYINDNLSSNIDNSELANIAGYHPYHLNRLFIKHTGKSMHKYILKARLNKAKQLILSTDYPLNEISTTVGFNSYAHFSDYFKKEFSLTPTEFRKNFKNKI